MLANSQYSLPHVDYTNQFSVSRQKHSRIEIKSFGQGDEGRNIQRIYTCRGKSTRGGDAIAADGYFNWGDGDLVCKAFKGKGASGLAEMRTTALQKGLTSG